MMAGPRQRPVHRYSDRQLAAIRDCIRRRDDDGFVRAIWDPILLRFEGKRFEEMAHWPANWSVGDFAISGDQSRQVDAWVAAARWGRFTWLSMGPHPLEEHDGE